MRTRITNSISPSTTLHLRTITTATVIGLIILIAAGISLALAWPAQWNQMIGTLILSIITTIIGVLLTILVAIFIIERYLARQRQEEKKKADRKEKIYQMKWDSYMQGGISMLSAVTTHICLYVAYGKERYLELTDENSSDIPDSIGDFIPALIKAFEETRRGKKEGTDIEKDIKTDDYEGSKGWGKDKATLLGNIFIKSPSIERVFTYKDLSVLKTYLSRFGKLVDQQMYLIQPFINRHIGIGMALSDMSRYIQDALYDIEIILEENLKENKPDTTLNTWKGFNKTYCYLGHSSVQVMQMIWAGEQDFDIIVPKGKSE